MYCYRTHRCRRATRGGRCSTVCMVMLGCLLCCGCSRDEYTTAAVSGRVTMSQKPLAEVTVTFQPIARSGNPNPGPGSTGITDSDGHFTLQVVGSGVPGAVVGQHTVRLASKRPPQDPRDDRTPPFRDVIPISWRDGSRTFDVPAQGTDQANLEVGSK